MQRSRRRALIASACLLAGCIIGSGDKPSTSNLARAPLVHRATAPACSSASPAEPDLTNVSHIGCTANADCPNGHCVVADSASSCVTSSCTKSADCPGIAVCECGTCVTGGCLVDADCGEVGYCSPTQGSCGTRSLVTNANQNGHPHHCHTTLDACLDDTDCTDVNAYCHYDASSLLWRCMTEPCP